jgi:type I restriction enzyme S subunit
MKFEAKRLGDIAEIIGGGTPSTKDPSNWDGDIPWLTPKDLSSFEGIYVDRGSRSITEQGFKTSSAKMLPVGAVLYTSRAPIGYVAIATNSISTNQGFKSLILKDGYVPEFVFYLLKASKSEIESHASGGTFAEISAKALSDVVLQFPPKIQQEAIAKLLKSLDEKIATNNALSKTLEGIAQTIFKSWFIDFDPVKAKMAGEKPVGMDAATAALFPDSIVESELGLIPKGWGVRSIGDSVVKQKVGKLFDSKTTFPSGSTPVLDQGKSGVVGFHDEEPGVFASPDTPLVVFANHTCSLRLISYPFSVIQNVFPLMGNQVDVIWLYFAVEGKQRFDSYKGHWPDFVLHKIIQPPEKSTQVFRKIVEPLLKQKWLLEQQSKILGNLRDSLLPRLISGELQIPDEMLAS